MAISSESDPRPDLVDLPAHERTYHGFNTLLHWCMVGLGASLMTLTLWFATPVGFLGGAIVGVVILAAGYFGFIRKEDHKPLDPWTPEP
ncbi:MAG: hypothetical protein JWP92_1902 [Caulobacter sp.]|nr:hypothetical protein [Caulobacter sp.]